LDKTLPGRGRGGIATGEKIEQLMQEERKNEGKEGVEPTRAAVSVKWYRQNKKESGKKKKETPRQEV